MVALLLSVPILAPSADPVFPEPQTFVTDTAKILSPETLQFIEQTLVQLEKQTSIEFAVVTVPSMGGRDIDGYAEALFRQWGIGKKDKDNGVLLLFAMQEKKVRIEVGYGLESLLTDGRSGEIIRTHIIPSFKQGRFDDGVMQGVAAIIQTVSPNAGFPQPAVPSRPLESPRWHGNILYIGLFVLVVLLSAASLAVRAIAALLVGGGFYVAGAGFVGAVFAGGLLFVMSLLVSARLGGWGGYHGRGGGFGGGFGGGSFGGFGGGSSGGGGASGGW